MNVKFIKKCPRHRSVEQKECQFVFNCRFAFIAERKKLHQASTVSIGSNFLRRAPNVGNELGSTANMPFGHASPFMNMLHRARSVLSWIGRSSSNQSQIITNTLHLCARNSKATTRPRQSGSSRTMRSGRVINLADRTLDATRTRSEAEEGVAIREHFAEYGGRWP